MLHKPALFASVALAACLLGSAATAQEAAATSEVGEVIVTAMKRGENVQDIPASISAVSGEAMQDRGVSDIQDLQNVVPNLNWGEHFGTTLITIRGVGSTVDSGITEPTVALYVDGVFLPRSTMATLRGVDLARVEVLRGPQGTLYGRNATGGAINFISQEPTRTFSGAVSVLGGSRDQWGVNGFLSGPVAPGIFARLSGGHEEQDGYVRQIPFKERVGGTDVDYVRGALRLEPSDNLTIDLAVRYENNDAPIAIQQLFTLTPLPTSGQTVQPNRVYANVPSKADVETTVANATVNWRISDDVTLRAITSYVDHESRVDLDADATDFDIITAVDFFRPSESYGQEFNLIGTSGPLEWLVGAYYFKEDSAVSLPLLLGTVGGPGFGVPVGSQLIESVDSKTESKALFIDLKYAVTERLKLNVGLRYNRETQKFQQYSRLDLPGVGVVPLLPAFAGGPVPTRAKSEKVLPKIGLQFEVADDVNLYAQWSRGFKSGGQNLEGGAGLSVGTLGLYKPELIDAYEIGLKTQSREHRLTANFAAFYYDYKDLQVTKTIPPTTTLVQNADAKVYGAEAEIHWQATDQLSFDASGTLTHARFDGFESFDDARPTEGLQDLDGEPLPHAPDVTVQLGAEYRISLPTPLFSSLTLRGDVSYTDDVVLRYFGTPNDVQDGYTLVDLSAKLTDDDEKTILRLFVRNLTDKHYKQNVTYLGAFGAYYGNYAPPRTWGAQLTRRF
jgi:iron complex outermembrane receptor protein